MNKLINEKSPYLKQHASNPVDWLPWGEEAFTKARTENKPTLVSVGYSTCHWCHVMAHESFEDEQVAEFLNNHFICVKVDREERPDVDNIYLTACQLFTGSGGWPLTAFVDDEKRPFFVGTYFPKASFLQLLKRIVELWGSNRKELLQQAENIVDAIRNPAKRAEISKLEHVPETAAENLMQAFDPEYGGFSNAPKFPTPHNLLFLTEFYKQTGHSDVLNAVNQTLIAMRQGGIYDHVGGGFSRYSTDRRWLVPHFEKMLYDNALLILAYSNAYSIKSDNLFADTVEGIFGYLNRNLKDANGAFYAAEDADSEGKEGKFYVFSYEEIKSVLGADAELFGELFGVTKCGNFEGANILNNIKNPIPEAQSDFSDRCIDKLAVFRSARIRPHRDEKIMVSNNGLLMAALAGAGVLFNKPEYVDTAENIAEFISENLKTKTGDLISYYLDGASKQLGFAEDYAFYIFGLLRLYSACGNTKYLNEAIALQKKFNENFFDSQNGGYYLSGINCEKILARTKELYDGAVPSYNSVTLHNLLDLYEFTNDVFYLEFIAKSLKCFSTEISQLPHAFCHSAHAIMRLQTMLPKMHICYNYICHPTPASISDFINIFS